METKICAKCGKELPLTAFLKHGHTKDGYRKVCKACESGSESYNPELAKFTPRQLIEELKARGYRGRLTYTQVQEINL